MTTFHQADAARAHRRRAAGAHRRSARAVQRHVLSARARRQRRAGRPARSGRGAHDRAADRSGAASPGAVGPGAARRGRGLSAARPVDPAPREQAQPERAEPRDAGGGGRLLGYPGALPQARVERLMGDYFRHARGVAGGSSGCAASAPVPVGAQPGEGRATASGSSIRARGQSARTLAVRIPGGDRRRHRRLRRHARVHPAARRTASPADDFFPDPARRAAWLEFLKPRAGFYARLSQMHDSGLLGRMLPEFGAITAASSATSTTSTPSTSTRC